VRTFRPAVYAGLKGLHYMESKETVSVSLPATVPLRQSPSSGNGKNLRH